jgi:hypothetical protein
MAKLPDGPASCRKRFGAGQMLRIKIMRCEGRALNTAEKRDEIVKAM